MSVYLNCSAGNGKPAARVGDSVSCPKHGTVSIVSGSPNTHHNGKPAARVGDKTSCGATIIEGSDSVLINGKPAAFVGCATTHDGKITSGSPTIFIGKAEVGTELDKDLEPYSMSLDLSTMHESGNYNGISYDRIAVEITKPDGTYITTISTDEHGITNRFYTKEQEDVIAWVDFGHWEVSEEYEVIDCDDVEDSTMFKTVKTGDLLSEIAHRHGTSIAHLQKINGITNPDRIKEGQIIALKAKAVCKVDVQLLDHERNPVKNAKILLDYSGKSKKLSSGNNGKLPSIITSTPENVVKISIERLDGTWKKITEINSDWGNKLVTLVSPKVKIETKTMPHPKDANGKLKPDPGRKLGELS